MVDEACDQETAESIEKVVTEQEGVLCLDEPSYSCFLAIKSMWILKSVVRGSDFAWKLTPLGTGP